MASLERNAGPRLAQSIVSSCLAYGVTEAIGSRAGRLHKYDNRWAMECMRRGVTVRFGRWDFKERPRLTLETEARAAAEMAAAVFPDWKQRLQQGRP
jgi:hypothetical protein